MSSNKGIYFAEECNLLCAWSLAHKSDPLRYRVIINQASHGRRPARSNQTETSRESFGNCGKVSISGLTRLRYDSLLSVSKVDDKPKSQEISLRGLTLARFIVPYYPPEQDSKSVRSTTYSFNPFTAPHDR